MDKTSYTKKESDNTLRQQNQGFNGKARDEHHPWLHGWSSAGSSSPYLDSSLPRLYYGSDNQLFSKSSLASASTGHSDQFSLAGSSYPSSNQREITDGTSIANKFTAKTTGISKPTLEVLQANVSILENNIAILQANAENVSNKARHNLVEAQGKLEAKKAEMAKRGFS
jgi:hypothetical protein